MTGPVATAAETTGETKLPIRRWTALGALLIAEYVLISVLFDAAALRRSADWRWLGFAGVLGPIVVVVAAVTWLLEGKRVRAEFREAMATAQDFRWGMLAAQVGCYAAFVTCSRVVFGRPEALDGRPNLALVALWALLGAGTIALWALSAAPPRALAMLWTRLRRTLVVGALVGSAAWGAGWLTMEYLWIPLSRVTLVLVVALLSAWSGDVVVDHQEAIVGTSAFAVKVSPICSGYEGIGLVAALLSIYLFTERTRLRMGNALWLLPIAMVTIYLANAVRIAALIVVGARWSPEIALGGLHSKAGWILVCAVCLAFVALSRRWAWLWREAPEQAGKGAHAEYPVAAYLLPLLCVIGVSMVTGLFVIDVDYLYGAAPTAAALVLVRVRHQLPAPSWPVNWQAPAVGAAVFAMWWGLEHALPPDPQRAELLAESIGALEPPWGALWIVARVLGSVVVIPVAEELAFRGYLLRRLIDRDFTSVGLNRFTWLSFVGSSLAFGLLHQRWIAGTLAGMAFAGVMLHRGRLSDAVVAHAVANALIAAVVLIGGQWSMWG